MGERYCQGAGAGTLPIFAAAAPTMGVAGPAGGEGHTCRRRCLPDWHGVTPAGRKRQQQGHSQERLDFLLEAWSAALADHFPP